MKKLNLFILFCLLSNIAIAADSSIWKSKIDRNYYYIGGDRISLGVIQFNAHNWRTHNITREVSRAPKMNYDWNDKWYYAYLPDSTNKIVTLFWKNHDRKTLGWVAIKNTPDAWYYKKNKNNWRKIGDGKKVVNFWKAFGNKDEGNRSTGSLSIDIQNYKNKKNSHGENKIRVSFGY